MAFWIAIAVLTAAATLVLLAPIYRARAGANSRDVEIAIYRDQLDELTRDVARGILPQSEAKSAQNEIKRRLIRAGEERPDTAISKTAGRLAPAVIAMLVIVPVLSVVLYLFLGQPNEPDMPIASRTAQANPADAARVVADVDAYIDDPTSLDGAQLAALGAVMDQALIEHPEEPALWERATLLFLRLGRNDDVVNAYGQLITTGGAEMDPAGGVGVFLAVQMIEQAQGLVPQAVELIGNVLAAHPENIDARFYSALILTGLGDTEGATTAWQWILDNAPVEATAYREEARRQLGLLGIEVPADPNAPAAMPPGAAEIAALPPDEQAARINQMVDGLAAQLAATGGPVADWLQLLRSYLVLGRIDEARIAVTNARTAFAGNAEALAQLDDGLITNELTGVTANPGAADAWARLILAYDVLGRADDAAQAEIDARAALAGNPEGLAMIDAAMQELETP